MHFFEIIQLTLDNLMRHALHRFGNVGEKSGLVAVVEQIEQRPRLAFTSGQNFYYSQALRCKSLIIIFKYVFLMSSNFFIVVF